MRKNRLRELLRQDKPSIGTHLMISWPAVVEMAGLSGVYDYVEFVGEYAPYDLYDLENLARTTELFGEMSSMLKVDQEPRAFLAERALGAGIQNILFADCRSVADVEECVRIVRAETPETGGIHGAGMRRNVRYVVEPGSPGFVEALDEAVVAIMIEKKGAVDNIEEVLSVKGVDMVQFGPSDYSMSIGIPGQTSHPLVREAERKTIETALRLGVAPRAEIGSAEAARRYLDMGVKHFCIGTDLVILADWWRQHGEALQKLVS